MMIHPEKRICVPLHPRAASRAIEPLLVDRGFFYVGTRHEGPLSFTTFIPTPATLVWFESEQWNWRYMTVVRHHLDAIGSWWFSEEHPAPGVKLPPSFVAEFPKRYPRLFVSTRRLWRFVWDVPGIEVLRVESLCNDLNGWLVRSGLPGLERRELRHDPVHMTPGKPQWNRDYWSDAAVSLVEAQYGAEMARLNYFC